MSRLPALRRQNDGTEGPSSVRYMILPGSAEDGAGKGFDCGRPISGTGSEADDISAASQDDNDLRRSVG